MPGRFLKKPVAEMHNAVRAIYEPFTVEEINRKIVEMLRPSGMTTPVDIVFQSIDGLHKAIPNNRGDWYSPVIIPPQEETNFAI